MELGATGGFHCYYKSPSPPLPTSSDHACVTSIRNETIRDNFHNPNRVFTTLLIADTQLLEINTTTNNDDSNNNFVADDDNKCIVREQDRLMPIANVIRIMRKVLPPNGKISDDAKETIQQCVSEFISFITGEANERCQLEQRKTIMAEDVLWAMNKLGFDDYIEPLSLYLTRFRESEGDHRGAIRSEPFVKMRAVEPNMGSFNVAPLFTPMGGFHYDHQGGGGFFGAPPPPTVVGGFMANAPNISSSSQALADLDQGPYI